MKKIIQLLQTNKCLRLDRLSNSDNTEMTKCKNIHDVSSEEEGLVYGV